MVPPAPDLSRPVTRPGLLLVLLGLLDFLFWTSVFCHGNPPLEMIITACLERCLEKRDERGYSMVSRLSPAETVAPSLTVTESTRPARVPFISFCIFMAST